MVTETSLETQQPWYASPALSNLDYGSYVRSDVTNIDVDTGIISGNLGQGRKHFNMGLRLMYAYQHELASHFFRACLNYAPECALAHGLLSLCHCPNYNFKGCAYYETTHHPEIITDNLKNYYSMTDTEPPSLFPSQQIAELHSRLAVEKVELLRKLKKRKKQRRHSFATGKNGHRRNRQNSIGSVNNSNNPFNATNNKNNAEAKSCDVSIEKRSTETRMRKEPEMIRDMETQILSAIRILTCHPGVDSTLAEEIVGRPYANAMRKVYNQYPTDAEVCYLFADSLMVLNAWSLYEYPTGRPLSKDVPEIEEVLEKALKIHPRHPGLCHLYVHLCEMSRHPAKALKACEALRNDIPAAGHLIHMPSHIDVLIGDYESCVRSNISSILADQKLMQLSPSTADTTSFYFGYIVHNYHMAVYGGILGAMEEKATEIANQLNEYLCEDLFVEHPDLTAYLESYSALDIHVMVRFGRWREILDVQFPSNSNIMLYRSATLRSARALALTNLKDIKAAKQEADFFDELKANPDSENRILHNNSLPGLFEVDAVMIRGEIAFFEGKYDLAFDLLRQAVALQDQLNYDEPWGKMQPIRHTLGGLLLKRGRVIEAEEVFRTDLALNPKNPWSLIGMIGCLRMKLNGSDGTEPKTCCKGRDSESSSIHTSILTDDEKQDIEYQLELHNAEFLKQRNSQWTDYNVTHACACCNVKES